MSNTSQDKRFSIIVLRGLGMGIKESQQKFLMLLLKWFITSRTQRLNLEGELLILWILTERWKNDKTNTKMVLSKMCHFCLISFPDNSFECLSITGLFVFRRDIVHMRSLNNVNMQNWEIKWRTWRSKY